MVLSVSNRAALVLETPRSPDQHEHGAFDMALSANSRVAPERRVRHDPVVYFIKPARLNYVKIGITRGICQRLYELQQGSPEPLRVIALLPGWVHLEAQLHYAFIRYHSHGEWFVMGKLIKAFLNDMHRPEFCAEEWLSENSDGKPAPIGEIKRYIGGKLQLTNAKSGFGHPDRKRGAGKLSETDARFIIENPLGLGTTALARRFEISRVAVDKIKSGKSWKGLADAIRAERVTNQFAEGEKNGAG